MPSLYTDAPPDADAEPALSKWRNRIIGHAVVPISELLANPLNWRVHPRAQRAALRELIDEVGVVGPIMVNVQTGNMVDGHLRSLLADEEGETHLPVDYVDLDPEEEAKILAGYDTITTMALVDKAKLAQTLSEIASTGPSLSAALAEMMERGASVSDTLGGGPEEDDDEADTAKERSTGELLAKLKEVTIGEPRHTPKHAEVYRLGNHVLVVAHPIREWASFTPYLTDDSCYLLSYPGPYAALTVAGEDHRLVMVQPDLYLAGHLLDRYADIHGEAGITRL